MWENDEEKERYLNLCERIWDLAEDFLREGYNWECNTLKQTFKEFSDELSEEDEEELNKRLR